MADNTLDKIIHDAARLPRDQQQRLIQILTRGACQPVPQKTIEQIASEQGKGPLDFSKLRKLGSFFPEEENVDDLIQLVRSVRQDTSARNMD